MRQSVSIDDKNFNDPRNEIPATVATGFVKAMLAEIGENPEGIMGASKGIVNTTAFTMDIIKASMSTDMREISHSEALIVTLLTSIVHCIQISPSVQEAFNRKELLS